MHSWQQVLAPTVLKNPWVGSAPAAGILPAVSCSSVSCWTD